MLRVEAVCAAAAVLLSLMSATADSNVVARHGPGALELVRAEAARALRLVRLGGAFSSEGRRAGDDLDRRFIARGTHPGGAADLLAVTIFLQAVESVPRGPVPCPAPNAGTDSGYCRWPANALLEIFVDTNNTLTLS